MSTEHKFTPGPWSHMPQKGTPLHGLEAQVFDRNGNSLALIEPMPDEMRATANARLIAATPALLEVLEALLPEWSEEDWRDAERDPHGIGGEFTTEDALAIRKAIALATGKS